jgi:hypothetical protein
MTLHAFLRNISDRCRRDRQPPGELCGSAALLPSMVFLDLGLFHGLRKTR